MDADAWLARSAEKFAASFAVVPVVSRNRVTVQACITQNSRESFPKFSEHRSPPGAHFSTLQKWGPGAAHSLVKQYRGNSVCAETSDDLHCFEMRRQDWSLGDRLHNHSFPFIVHCTPGILPPQKVKCPAGPFRRTVTSVTGATSCALSRDLALRIGLSGDEAN
jgi:hypothetical protein